MEEYKKLWEQFIIKPTKNTNYHFSRFYFASNLFLFENSIEIEERCKKVMDSPLTYSSSYRDNTINFIVTHQYYLLLLWSNIALKF